MGYGIVLKEKRFEDGLNKTDLMELFDILKDDTEVYPIELRGIETENNAMGFIDKESARAFEWDYEESGLHDFVAVILDNVDNDKCCEYEFRGVKIYLCKAKDDMNNGE